MPDLASGKYISQADALTKWWPAARSVLVETAGRYGAWITEDDLARRIQTDTGISTRQPSHEWIGNVLSRVAADAASRGEPRLASLCVGADLAVGDHVGAAPGSTVDAREQQAAQDRFDCYRVFGATLPPDGGRPQRTPRALGRPATRARRAPRDRGSVRAPSPAPSATMREVTCTRCFMVVPAAVTCRECGATLALP